MKLGKNLTILLLIVIIIIESLSLSLFKKGSNKDLIFGIILYIFVLLGLYKLINIEGLAVGHAIYDVSSVILVTLIGLIYFKEKINTKKIIGLILALISVILLL